LQSVLVWGQRFYGPKMCSSLWSEGFHGARWPIWMECTVAKKLVACCVIASKILNAGFCGQTCQMCVYEYRVHGWSVSKAKEGWSERRMLASDELNIRIWLATSGCQDCTQSSVTSFLVTPPSPIACIIIRIITCTNIVTYIIACIIINY
jgi:hypothetical protein